MIPPFVDRRWLAAHPDVVLADVRFYLDGRSTRDAYGAGHLPGAIFVDLESALAAPPSSSTGRHPLPEPEVFAQAMARVGIGDNDTVIGYDDGGGVFAARLVWMLRVTGHQAALLDGGFEPHDPGRSVRWHSRPPAVFSARPWPPERIATIVDAADRSNVVIDARDRDRFRGDSEPVDARPGHIPGARNVPCRENLGPDRKLLPVAEVQRRFAAVGVGEGSSVVSYCGSGVTACHNLLALEHVGLGLGRLYPGSWSQYAAQPDLAASTGE